MEEKINLNDIEYSNDIRMDIESTFKELCKKDISNYIKLISISKQVHVFLSKKIKSQECIEYYIAMINIRIRDHFMSGTMLFSKGFTVDAITLVRSALEDLWVIQNLYYNKDFYNKWKSGDKIRIFELRNLDEIQDRREFNENVYSSLCNISHCRLDSIQHMGRFHPCVENKGSEGSKRLLKDYSLLVMSYHIYFEQIIELFIKYYINKNDEKELKEIERELIEIREDIYPQIKNV